MATTGKPTPCLGVPESEQAALAEIDVPAEFLPTLLEGASLMVIGRASDFGVVGFRPGQSLEPELDAALAGLREALEQRAALTRARDHGGPVPATAMFGDLVAFVVGNVSEDLGRDATTARARELLAWTSWAEENGFLPAETAA